MAMVEAQRCWQEFSNVGGFVGWQSSKYVFQVDVGIMAVEFSRLQKAHDCGRTLAGAQRTREQPVRSSKSDRPYLPFDMVVIDGHGWILNVADECRPAFEAVVDSSRDGRSVRHPPPLFIKPEMQRIQDWSGPLLSRF